VFSSAVRAFDTPVCRSARTLVVLPGVREMRRLLRFGDGGWRDAGWREGEAGERGLSVSMERSFEEEAEAARVGRCVAGWPSSARARAFPTEDTGIPIRVACKRLCTKVTERKNTHG
jgi:hypothetical protein